MAAPRVGALERVKQLNGLSFSLHSADLLSDGCPANRRFDSLAL
jgi:hypothetical protein